MTMESSAVKYEEFQINTKSKTSNTTKYIVVGAAILVIALLAMILSAGIAIGITGTQNTNNQQSEKAGLTTITTTEEELEAEYYGPNGTGIYIRSTVNDTYVFILITTTTGETVLSIMHPLTSHMTMMSVNHTNFMVMESHTQQDSHPEYDDYIIPNYLMELARSIVKGDTNMTNDIRNQFYNSTVEETRYSVLRNLAVSDEAVLIIKAAQAIGERGIQGHDSKAVMKFYQLAMIITKARGKEIGNIDISMGTQKKRSTEQKTSLKRSILCSNGASCPSSSQCPSGSECFGQCGYECFCWRFVCGDCCVHNYCLTHDACCERRGFFSFACLSVSWRVFVDDCTDIYSC